MSTPRNAAEATANAEDYATADWIREVNDGQQLQRSTTDQTSTTVSNNRPSRTRERRNKQRNLPDVPGRATKQNLPELPGGATGRISPPAGLSIDDQGTSPQRERRNSTPTSTTGRENPERKNEDPSEELPLNLDDVSSEDESTIIETPTGKSLLQKPIFTSTPLPKSVPTGSTMTEAKGVMTHCRERWDATKILNGQVEKFATGRSSDLQKWLRDYSKVVHTMGIPKEIGTAVISMYLKGPALQKYNSLSEEKTKNWETMVTNLVAAHHCPTDKEVALQEFSMISQGHQSPTEFAERIRTMGEYTFEDIPEQSREAFMAAQTEHQEALTLRKTRGMRTPNQRLKKGKKRKVRSLQPGLTRRVSWTQRAKRSPSYTPSRRNNEIGSRKSSGPQRPAGENPFGMNATRGKRRSGRHSTAPKGSRRPNGGSKVLHAKSDGGRNDEPSPIPQTWSIETKYDNRRANERTNGRADHRSCEPTFGRRIRGGAPGSTKQGPTLGACRRSTSATPRSSSSVTIRPPQEKDVGTTS
ncbi:unnamed protein product [Caenorhabditis sp. 36 PRJEB53466]|nr:unnamed protein product [Caenorhabditis sp. 36 PRJEB53466]